MVERMREWRQSGFHAYAEEEIPDIEDALRMELYMVQGIKRHPTVQSSDPV
jgi:hypothetical protein